MNNDNFEPSWDLLSSAILYQAMNDYLDTIVYKNYDPDKVIYAKEFILYYTDGSKIIDRIGDRVKEIEDYISMLFSIENTVLKIPYLRSYIWILSKLLKRKQYKKYLAYKVPNDEYILLKRKARPPKPIVFPV